MWIEIDGKLWNVDKFVLIEMELLESAENHKLSTYRVVGHGVGGELWKLVDGVEPYCSNFIEAIRQALGALKLV